MVNLRLKPLKTTTDMMGVIKLKNEIAFNITFFGKPHPMANFNLIHQFILAN